MSKYHAQPLVLDNIRFASTKEAHRYQELKLLERAGQIFNLRLQPRYELRVPLENGSTFQVGAYVADFAYWDLPKRQVVVEDVKGFKTPLYRWKKKHVEAQYGVQILEV